MSSAADKIRENALRVKGNNESRRTQPAESTGRVVEAQPVQAERASNTNGGGLAARQNAQSSNGGTAHGEGAAKNSPPAKPRRVERTQSTPATPTFAPRQTPVRRTVDLTPAAHSKLDDWQRKTAREIGVARVTGQEVLATLVDEFLDNPELSAVVRDAIWRRRQ